MVKTHHLFNCDICGEQFASQSLAIQCENRGQPRIVFPRGLIFQSETFSDNPIGRVFAVKCDNIVGHSHSLECWEIDEFNWGDMEGIENRVKVFEFTTGHFQIMPESEKYVSGMEAFLKTIKGIQPIVLTDMPWWEEGLIG